MTSTGRRHQAARGVLAAPVARWVVAGVLAVGLALAPAVAVAGGLEDDPTPSDWPTIAAPVDDRGGASDPMPEAQPTVAKPNEGSSNDPQPSDWPTPVQQ